VEVYNVYHCHIITDKLRHMHYMGTSRQGHEVVACWKVDIVIGHLPSYPYKLRQNGQKCINFNIRIYNFSLRLWRACRDPIPSALLRLVRPIWTFSRL